MPFGTTDKAAIPGEGRVRMADLARLAGVSVATVSRSLNDSPLIHPATKNRVWQVACRHGYAAERDMPEALRAAPASLAVMVGCGHRGPAFDPALDPSMAELMTGVVAAALDARCHVMFTHLSPPHVMALEAAMRMTGADAFLFLDQGGLHDALGRLPDDARVLAWGERDGAAYGVLSPDHFAAGRVATAHLIAQGCRAIAYAGDTEGPEMSARFMGYLTALNEAGISFDPRLLTRTADAPGVPCDGVFVAAEPLLVPLMRGPAHELPVAAWHGGHGRLPAAAHLALVSADMAAAGRRVVARLLGNPSRTTERMPVTLRLS